MDQNSKTISDIEVLRAVAIILTAFSHLGDLFPWGNEFYQTAMSKMAFWGGVDLFFVISGYVISRRLLQELAGNETKSDYWRKTKAFWVRRIFRIIPSAWAWLLITLFLSIAFNTSGTFRTTEANFYDALAGMLHFANFRHYLQFKGDILWGGNSVFWSLSLEEQFYLLLPLLIFISGKHFIKVAIVIALSQIFIVRPQGSFLWEIRTDALFIGVLIAVFAQSKFQEFRPKFLDSTYLRNVFVCFLLVSLTMVPSQFFNVTNKYTGALAILSGLLVWIASYNRSYIISQRQIRPILIWIGSRSFAIYLIHIPAYRVAYETWYRLAGEPLNDQYTFQVFFTAMFLMGGLAEINFRYLESPLRHYGASRSKRILSSS